MATWITPVFDRVEADVIFGNPKGCLDAAVLNRIENNIQYLQEVYTTMHVTHIDCTRVDTSWNRAKYIYLDQFNTIKQNITNLRNSAWFLIDTPVLISSVEGDGTTWDELNRMERILYDIKDIQDSASYMYRKLNTFTLGSNYQRQLIRVTRR